MTRPETPVIREPLTMIACPDIAGQVRGKGFPTAELERRLERGVGWVPTNMQITAFDVIPDTPYGPRGDLLLLADRDTEVRVDFADGSPVEHFFLGRIRHTDGSPWACCLRTLLDDALGRLRATTGFDLLVAFEHEFHMVGGDRWTGTAYSLDGFRAHQAFGETLAAALRAGGLAMDSFLREFGRDQYEVTVAPRLGLRAADDSAVLRQLTRATARRLAQQVSFSPMRTPDGVGNGVHLHMSFVDAEGRPRTHDPAGPGGLAPAAGAFVAGVLRHLPAYTALTAAGIVSYARLTPNRWSAAYNNLGLRDREAAVRICPVDERPGADPAGQFNIEFRAADATASPHLQLAAIVLAGLRGIADGLAVPTPTHEDLTALDAATLALRGIRALPGSLEAALDAFAGDATVRGFFPAELVDIYLRHKRGEVAVMAGKPADELCRAYERVY